MMLHLIHKLYYKIKINKMFKNKIHKDYFTKIYPISAKTNNSCGSNGNSVVKLVRKNARTVSAF